MNNKVQDAHLGFEYPRSQTGITDGGTTVEMEPTSTESDRQEALAHLRSDPVLDGAYMDMAERGESVPNTWVKNVDQE